MLRTSPLMAKAERWIAVFFGLLLGGLLAGIHATRVDLMRGDTAIFLQTTENIAHGKPPDSQVFANTQAFLDGKYFKMTADELATDPLAPPAHDERNLLRFHAYWILYPLALFVTFLPAEAVIFASYGLAFAGMLVVAYLVLRRRNVAPLPALLFCALVVSEPAWGSSAVWGQFYPDRLFMLAGLGFMFVFARARFSPAWTIGLALLCALVNERGAITAGGFAFLYTALYWRRIDARRMRLVLAAGLLLYGLIALKFVITDASYSSFLPRTPSALMKLLQLPSFLPDIGLFLLANLPLLALACAQPRKAGIAFALMLPNLFGNIGGAEKVGWTTHYHSYYFPALVWAALSGYATLTHSGRPRMQANAVYAATLAAILLFIPFAPDGSFLVTFPTQTELALSSNGRMFRALVDPLPATIPTGTVVSTVEGGMPFLYHGRKLRLFPIGIDTADYAVVNDAGMVDGKHRYSGTVSFGSPGERSAVDRTIQERMRRDGYDLDHPVMIRPLGLAIVKRR